MLPSLARLNPLAVDADENEPSGPASDREYVRTIRYAEEGITRLENERSNMEGQGTDDLWGDRLAEINEQIDDAERLLASLSSQRQGSSGQIRRLRKRLHKVAKMLVTNGFYEAMVADEILTPVEEGADRDDRNDEPLNSI